MKQRLNISGQEFTGIILISVIAGIGGAIIVSLFNLLLDWLLENSLRVRYFPSFLLPLAGALITGFLFLRFFPGSERDGTSSYITTVNDMEGRFDIGDTLVKFPATLLTLGLYGSGGIVGTLSRIGAGLSNLICPPVIKVFHIKYEKTLHIAAVCGMSAVVSAIFHSPLGGALFAAEILKRNTLQYSDIFPAISAGCVAVITSIGIGQSAVFEISVPHYSGELYLLAFMFVAAVFGGVVGYLFIVTYGKLSEIFGLIPFRQPVKAVIGGVVISLLFLAGGREILSTSMPLYHALGSGDTTFLHSLPFHLGNTALLLILLMFLKLAATSITVGSGMSGGLTGPLLVMGTAGGAFLCSVWNIEFGSPAYYGVLCCCTAAILSSTLNVPLAAILIAIAIFNSSYILPAVIGSFISFILFRSAVIFEYPEEPLDQAGDVIGKPR